MPRLVALALVLSLAGPAVADAPAAASRAKTIAPFLDEQTFAVARVDLAKVDYDTLLARVGKAARLTAKELDALRKGADRQAQTLKKAGVRELYIVCSMAAMPRLPISVVAPVHGDADPQEMARALKAVLSLEAEPVGKAVVAAEPALLRELKHLKPTAHAEVARGMAAAGDGAVQLVVFVPRYLRKALEESLPNLPAELGGGPIATVTQGFSWAAVGVTLKPRWSVQAVAQAKDADAAQALQRLFDHAFRALSQPGDLKRMFPRVEALREVLRPAVEANKLTLTLNEQELVAVVVPMVAEVREAAARNQGMNNLKQMALAMHNYHDTFKTFPAHASYDKQGKPLLSWRVHILPFIDQAALYKEFHLDEPWDSEHNKKLIARMPGTYRSPVSKAEAGKTTYLVPVGKETIFPPGPKGLQIRDITDGTSNTILLVEADDAHAVYWTRPDDLRVDLQQPHQGLNMYSGRGFLAALADGSVRMIGRKIAAHDLRALFTRNGGEVIGEIP